jgi:hypothetical protein
MRLDPAKGTGVAPIILKHPTAGDSWLLRNLHLATKIPRGGLAVDVSLNN